MALQLTRRLVKGAPLTAQDHDGNLDVLEAAIGTPGPGGGLVSASGTAPIQVANGTTAAVISIAPSSATNAGSMSAADKAKLNGIATGATANATDAELRDRATHTGTQLAATVSDFVASSRAQTEATLTAGTNVTLIPSGAGATRSIQINATAGGAGVATVTGTAPITSTGGGSPAIGIVPASALTAGSMSQLDFIKLAGVAEFATANAGTVTNVTGAGEVQVANGASIPVISIAPANASAAGSLSGPDFLKLSGIATGATANATDAALRSRATHTGTQTASTISDFNASSRGQTEGMLTAGPNVTLTPTGTGATRAIQISATAGGAGVAAVTGTAPITSTGGGSPDIAILPASGSAAGSMSSADFVKLAGVATGATANAADAALRDRATHTGTQLAATVSDFTASSRAQVEATLTAGSGVTLTPSGAGATRAIQISATAVGGVTSVTGTAPITSSGGATPAIGITPATTTVAGAMSAADKTKLDGVAPGATANLGTVTQVSGTGAMQSTGGTTPTISIVPASVGGAGSMSQVDFNKLAGIATGATANATDAALRDRATHTGTQLAATVSDFTASSRAQVEATLTAGTNVTLTPTGTGATRSIQISATAGAAGVAAVTGTAPITSSGGGSPDIAILPASGSAAGSMSSADFTKLAGVAPGATANVGTVTQVSGTGAISSTGAPTPVISIRAATATLSGTMSPADFNKLEGIAPGATANLSNASLLERGNHTGTQVAATIVDFNNVSRAQTEAMLTAGTGITLTPSGTGATRAIALAVASTTPLVTQTIAYAAAVALDMAAMANSLQTVSLAGNISFSATNLAAGRTVAIRIICDATTRTLAFPAGWVFIGGAGRPASILSAKTGILSITSFGATDAQVVAAWAVQP